MTAENLSGPLKVSAPSMKTLVDVLRGCNSLKRLPKRNKLFPEL